VNRKRENNPPSNIGKFNDFAILMALEIGRCSCGFSSLILAKMFICFLFMRLLTGGDPDSIIIKSFGVWIPTPSISFHELMYGEETQILCSREQNHLGGAILEKWVVSKETETTNV
jgi:hypothetical protein